MPASGAPRVCSEHTIEGDFSGASSVYTADVDGGGEVDVPGAAEYGVETDIYDNGFDQGIGGGSIVIHK